MLGKCKQPDQASFLFEKMMSESLEPTVDVYTSLVRAYGLSGFLDEAFRTVTEMNSLSDCRPDVYTYSTLLHCCIKLCRFDLIDHVLDNMSNSGIECNTVTYNTIIDGYGKAGMFELMESSLTEMIETGSCLPDVFTLNTFTWAYGNAGDIDKMERWYDEFQHMGVKPDIKTFNILIRSYGKTGMCDKIGLVMEFMGKRFYSPNVVTFNTVIEMFGKAGNIERMEYFFRTMKYRGVKPNYVTYCSLVSGYSKAGHVKKVGSILRQVENSDVVLDTPYFNCVINAYGQAGELKLMEDMFVEMKERDCKPDDITFSIMIQAYKSQGMVGAAQELEIHLLGRKGNPGSLIRLQPWTPNFNSETPKQTNALVWVRFVELSVEYWNIETLMSMGKTLGTPVDVDNATRNLEYGFFVSVLVDIDMTNPIPEKLQDCRVIHKIKQDSRALNIKSNHKNIEVELSMKDGSLRAREVLPQQAVKFKLVQKEMGPKTPNVAGKGKGKETPHIKTEEEDDSPMIVFPGLEHLSAKYPESSKSFRVAQDQFNKFIQDIIIRATSKGQEELGNYK
ncbi:hypothetical protein GIB67_006914 [Kingdonia uniflora]|uniref:Pentatricopeptide repeat-containing protein n=1 Tax=Kingdonia uniflora TaxID=39325 RepID=A0A7J7L0D4_9MAGN|nr:hypothetical protein GIB67_006914 [Kingdonia uniflora]